MLIGETHLELFSVYFKDVQCLTEPIVLLSLETPVQELPHPLAHRVPSLGSRASARALERAEQVLSSLVNHVLLCLSLN